MAWRGGFHVMRRVLKRIILKTKKRVSKDALVYRGHDIIHLYKEIVVSDQRKRNVPMFF